MAILAIGDIHGCSKALDYLLELVQPSPQDTLITLGDYVDKGKDSKGVIERLLSLQDQTNLVPLKGNHELFMLHARKDPLKYQLWLRKGGQATLKSYKEDDINKIPELHWNFIEKVCINSYETRNNIFVHAGVASHLPLASQPVKKLFWQKLHYPQPHISGKVVVCGHTSQKSGNPLNLGHTVCIDTWACGKGWLTCMDATTGRLWQTNEKKQSRVGNIEEYYQNGWIQTIGKGSEIFGGSFLSKAIAIVSKGK